MRLLRLFAFSLLHGPAELLPVSSSAHVGLLLRSLSDAERKELEVAVHFGTLCALGLPRPRAWLIASTAPPAVAGLLLERRVEALGPQTTALGLIAGGAALAAADLAPKPGTCQAPPRKKVGTCQAPQRIGLRQALMVGVAQAAALVPGVSRLGATLTVLRALGLDRRDAHAVSVEASRPVLLGATMLKGLRVLQRGGPVAPLAVSAAGSYVSTRAALRVLGGRALPLWPFAIYRAALGGSVLRMARRPTAADV